MKPFLPHLAILTLIFTVACNPPEEENVIDPNRGLQDFREPASDQGIELQPIAGESGYGYGPQKTPKRLPAPKAPTVATAPEYDPFAGGSSQTQPRRSEERNGSGGLFEGLLENEIRKRGPDILESILGNREDAELVSGILEHAPAVWGEIESRSKKEGVAPSEVVGNEILGALIDEGMSQLAIPPELGESGPEVLDNVRKGAEDGSLGEMIGTAILRELLKGEK